MSVKTGMVIALENRLRRCSNVMTLGVKPDFSDYSPEAAGQIRQAAKIYYPSSLYAPIFGAMGKPVFPSVHTYHFAQDKIRQTGLFMLQNIPCPKTRIFYGKEREKEVRSQFAFPLIAKIPRGSALGRGVFLVRNREELAQYCALTHAAYIQEFLPIDRDIRVVVIGDRVALAYWRIAAPGEFRCNVARGAAIRLDGVPRQALELALYTAGKCGWNDVGIDICEHKGNFFVLEGNMKYGREGFARAGIDYTRLMENMIDHGQI